LPKHTAYSPKHRKPQEHPLAEAPKKAARTTLLLSALAIGGTSAAVAGGVVLNQPANGDDQVSTAADIPAPPATVDPKVLADRERDATTSRSSDRRQLTDPDKRAALGSVTAKRAKAVTREENVLDDDPRTIASAMLSDYGWDAGEMDCLDSLWTKESGWQVNADNPSSSAYGIPQALPGSKMASAGSDWATNPATQIEWGLGYIEDRYGSPCGAWGHSQSMNWY